jgi:putative intracellular protease/amidase
MAKVLIVLTGARVWSQKDGTQRPTGFWTEEFAVPHRLLTEAGAEITIATPGGLVPVPDQTSLSAAANGGDQAKADEFRGYLEKVQPLLDKPERLEDIDPARFDAVLIPGGHGPMQDLAVNPDVARVLAALLPDDSKTVASLCHGPAAFLPVGDENGDWLFKGRQVTAFTNEEENQAGLDANAPWLVEDRLRSAGAIFAGGPAWQSHVVTDGNLITGQNPASGEAVAKAILARLGQ